MSAGPKYLLPGCFLQENSEDLNWQQRSDVAVLLFFLDSHKSQLDGATMQHQLANLRPYTKYQISVIVHNKKGQSWPVVYNATTQFTSESSRGLFVGGLGTSISI